jgi:hypothetical protein
MPPGPVPSPDDVAEFWTKTRACFAIESVQKKNSSVLSRLVNAFVEVPPENTETDVPDRGFVRSHPLLPQLPGEDYMTYDFDVRLMLALERLELNHPVTPKGQETPTFQQEIDELRQKIETDLLPALEQDFRELRENLPIFRQLEKRRNERQILADRMLQDYFAKKGVPKK